MNRTLELPQNVHGLIKYWMVQDVMIFWRAPWLEMEFQIEMSDIVSLSISQRLRILRLIELDAEPVGNWIARAIGVAARCGRIFLALRLLNCWVEALEPGPELAAQGRELLAIEVTRSKGLLKWQREWPQSTINLQDQPAWLIPSVIKRMRYLGRHGGLTINSGGHILAPQNWIWEIPENQSQPCSVVRVRQKMIEHFRTAI